MTTDEMKPSLDEAMRLYTARRASKRYIRDMMVESALASGKRVIVVTPTGATLRRRVKHLTLIQSLPGGQL